jgi:uncharacterized protein (TIGR02117 family)
MAAVLLIAFVITGCSASPYVIEPKPGHNPVYTHRVYVVSHGWHAGLIVSASDVNQSVPALQSRFGNAAFYEIGWGDKNFYQAHEITLKLKLQALFWSQGAVLHVVALDNIPERYFAGQPLISTCLSDNEQAALRAFIASSFRQDASGHILALGPGIYGNSEFYEGAGNYNLVNTCNKWLAKALRSAGSDIDPTFKLTTGSIMNHLTRHQRSCSPIESN